MKLRRRWGFGEARHALWYGDRIVFDSCRDMGLTAADARRIERLLNAAEALEQPSPRCEHERVYFYRRASFHESQHFNADRAGDDAREDLARARPLCAC